MTTIATLAVRLIGDIADYHTAMNDAVKTSQKTADAIGKNIQNVGSNITNLGQRATVGLTAPLLAAGAYAVDLASDYEETKNKTMVVFGEMADSIVANADRANTALGISKTEYLDYASSLGAAFTAGGMGIQESTQLAERAVQHFADLASFHNSTAEDVSTAWQSAIRGQYEPIQKYFPFITNEYMKTYGIANGLIDESTENLTANQRAIILNAIAMNESLNPAVNDFAETADGLANSQRQMTALLKDSAIALGQQLLPYVLQGVQFLSDLLTKFQALSPEQQRWVLLIAGAAAAIGPVLIGVGSLVTAIGALVPVITAVGGALLTLAPYLLIIAAVAALVYFAWTQNWFGIQEKTQTAIAFIQMLIDGGMQFINDLTSGKLGWMSEVWNNAVNTVMMIVNTWITNVKLLFQAFQAAWNGDWYKFGEIMRQIWDNTWTMLTTILKNGWANFKIIISEMVTGIINFFKNTDWGMVGKNIVEGIANGIKNGASAIANAAIAASKAALAAVQGFLGIHSASTVYKTQVGWEMAAGTAGGFMDGLDQLLKPAMVGLQPVPVGAGVGTLPSANVSPSGGGAGMGGGSDAVVYLLDELLRAIKDLPGELTRSLRALVEKFGGQRK